MRHLGWLHATPEGSKKSRMATFRSVNEEHASLVMPDIETEHAAGYMIGLLQEAGLMSFNGMGPVPISWQEINSWLSVTGNTLTTWELLTIKQLSEEYVAELVQASSRDRPAPFAYVEVEDIDRVAVADKIANVMSRFIRKKPEEIQIEEEHSE